ncbi:hypothetical protein [Spirochaeta dissipatitropha]
MELNVIIRRQYFICLDSMKNLIDHSPNEIWNMKKGGFVFWQQILHAITGSLFWLRTGEQEFAEPFSELKVYPELEKDPENYLSKTQLENLLQELHELAAKFFRNIDSAALLAPSEIYRNITNLDVILGQIRHLMYHIGHCESILRDTGVQALPWIDYFGEQDSI